MSVALSRLPRYLVLEPTSTVRIDVRLEVPECEIDVSLDNPRPGRSFVLLIGPPGGPFAQRVRLSGRARIHFDPKKPGRYSMLLANPQADPIVVRLKVKELPASTGESRRSRRRKSPGPERPRRRSPARPGSSSSAPGRRRAYKSH